MLRSRRGAAILLGVVVVAAIALRFWRLDVPPTWLDESVTALIAAGRGPVAFPMDRVMPLVDMVGAFDPHVSADTREVMRVFRDPLVQDLHPPTFHLLSNVVLRAGLSPRRPLVARVRSLAAIFGVAAVIVIFFVAQRAFDSRTAVVASALMAVSPYAVMLSREARNYSCAMLMVTISTGAMLMVARPIDERESARSLRWWIVWAAASAAGLYVHYFVLFAWVAQAVVLAYVCARARSTAALRTLAVMSALVMVAVLPLIPLLVYHQASPEQTWLRFDVNASAPLAIPYVIASAWQTMLLGKAWNLGEPVYTVTKVIALAIYLCTLTAVLWALWRSTRGSTEERQIRLLLLMIAIVLIEYVAAMLLQRKDFVSEARYHVIYYPPLALIVAWVCARRLPVVAAFALIAAGTVNSVMVDLDVESWKGTEPAAVIARLEAAASPALIVAGVGNFNETVVQASLLFEYARRARVDGRSVAFVGRTESPVYGAFNRHARAEVFWSRVSALRPDLLAPTLIIHSGGMLPDEYKRSIVLTSASGASVTCAGMTLDDEINKSDNLLMHPAFRRYACATAPTPAQR